MLRNTYIMSVILCISALMQGAADNPSDRDVVRPTAALLTLADCFDQRTTLIPGRQKFYVPIIISSTRRGHAQSKIWGIPLGRERRRVKCCVGFFEGDDEAGTQEIAKQFVATLDLESARMHYGSLKLDFSFLLLKLEVLKSNTINVEQVINVKHKLFLLESVPKDPRWRIRIPGAGTVQSDHLSFCPPSAALMKAR